MFDLLPQEVVEKIFSHSSTEDMKNVSCCSRSCHASLKHLLWNDICIPFLQSDLKSNALHNLKYTEWLQLGQYCGNNSDDEEIATGQEMIKSGFSYGFHFAQVLNYCTPSKMKGLVLIDIAAEGVSYAVTMFKSITNLTLNCINLEKWDCLQELKGLQRLVLIECNVDEIALKECIDVKSLIDLSLTGCTCVNNAALQYICSEAVNLIEFRFENNGSDEDMFNFGLIANLKELKFLYIFGSPIDNASLILISQSLAKLEGLYLPNSMFSDEGFSQIHLLASLKRLELTDCEFTTVNKCMVFISTLPSLREIWFSGNIGSSDYGNLNYISTLEEINIIGRRNKCEKKVNSILKELCESCKWRLRIFEDGDFDRYCLTYCSC